MRRLLDQFRPHVLAVRIGATDLSGQYGLRRSREHTVYDVALLAAVIGDVVNALGRDDGGYPITGPVWEYFSSSERIFKPQLRESPFIRHDERKLRAQLIARDLDGLIREVSLDRANGLIGKSVIHPSHVAAVNALSVVSHEEYLDAIDILGTSAGGGVASSAYGNKMNESKPHTAWARRTELRSRAFGVAHEDVSFVDLLPAERSLRRTSVCCSADGEARDRREPGVTGFVGERFGVTLRGHGGEPLGELVELALRRNPKRAHLLVSTVLGKHIPVDPRSVHETGLRLGRAVADRLTEPSPRW